MSRHGSSKKGPRQNKSGVWSRGRSGQVIAAHHARIRLGSTHSQIKKRIWKSAIARAKRIGDHGRKSAPIVKVEAAHQFTHFEVDDQNTSQSDDDDLNQDACFEATIDTTGANILHQHQAISSHVEASIEHQEIAGPSASKSLKRAVAGGKKAAANARKKLAQNRKSIK